MKRFKSLTLAWYYSRKIRRAKDLHDILETDIVNFDCYYTALVEIEFVDKSYLTFCPIDNSVDTHL
jgi:hypothetical protein